jgi:hypothetical protein
MHRLIALLAGLAAGPILGVALLQATAPAFADVSVGSTTACASANPHPTDPAGSTSASLFCATPNPTANGSGKTAGGSQGKLTSANGSGTSSGSGGSGVSKTSGKSATSSDGGFFGGLVGFFSAMGGLVFLFVLLVLMAIVLLALAVIAWLRRGQEGNWASRASRLTFRPKN